MGTVIDSKAVVDSATPLDMPASSVIRERLQRAGERFHANDNISAFLKDGELSALQDEVAVHIANALRAMVIDVDNDHNTRDTAKRIAKMYLREVFAGRYESAPPVTEFPNVGQLDELMVIGPLRLRSTCSHHLCPIMGHAWIGVLPNARSNLPGLSKYSRLLNWVMSRPQIQEEAVKQIADLLEQRIAPDGLAVVIEADHYCMHWRGTKDDGAQMTTSVMRGRFLEDAALRKEFLSLLKRKNS
ncbi:GTP cyclohydrolase I [Paraburkholderia sp. SUR17]|uniref:GTP cyclohydrolase I n=1 Tax=Paraburkholderia sp. SUR17 TaxID=3034358 RepID=UPI002407A8EC|nr:GTP cyclohydrolase I [Paraburkholderia sp. SUR17]WEY37687.1 GTP cyclohydrolase I [Paraburkholderia sp. SUR17]